MKILQVNSSCIEQDNLYWVKYAVINPNLKVEVRSVSFRELESAEQYLKSINHKIK